MAQASVVRSSSVRKLKFLRNRCMDPDQILWEATYQPYLQTIFLFFQNFQFSNFYDFFFFFVNIRQNTTPPPVFFRSEPNFIIN